MVFLRSWAGLADDDEFALFRCQPSGAASPPWTEEAENYIRARLLRRQGSRVLAFREDGHLIAVSSFYPSEVGIPVVSPVVHPAWHLEVLAVTHSRQRTGFGLQVLDQTLVAMRETDPTRVLVVARAHVNNRASLALCARRDITPFVREGDYWKLLGEVPG